MDEPPQREPLDYSSADVDDEFAQVLHQWLDSHPGWNRRLREAVERWLVARRL